LWGAEKERKKMKGWISTEGVRTGKSRKTGGKRPSWRGMIRIGDREFWLSGWPSESGTKIDLAATEKPQEGQQ
jgi:hypothetical protein